MTLKNYEYNNNKYNFIYQKNFFFWGGVTLRECHAWLTKKIFSKRTIRRDITLVLKG